MSPAERSLESRDSASLRSKTLSFLYQTGIWWPHQSWRLMHQSWMFCIQLEWVLTQRSGRYLMSPLRTASVVSSVHGYFRNHCMEMRGSTGTSARSE